MLHNDTIPLHSSSQSDIDEIENLIHDTVQSAKRHGPVPVPAARPPSPPRVSIQVSSFPFVPSATPPTFQKPQVPVPTGSSRQNIGSSGFGSAPNTLTEPIWDTAKRVFSRIVSNLKLVVFPNPYREDPGRR